MSFYQVVVRLHDRGLRGSINDKGEIPWQREETGEAVAGGTVVTIATALRIAYVAIHSRVVSGFRNPGGVMMPIHQMRFTRHILQHGYAGHRTLQGDQAQDNGEQNGEQSVMGFAHEIEY